MWLAVVVAPLAWLLGTFPSAVLVARARGIDITREGSGNPGASNVVRVLGWRAGLLVLALDIAKGAAAAGAGLAIADRPGAWLLGAAATLGHTLPLWRKGGKGVATAGGFLIVLFPEIAVAALVVWFAVVGVTRKASLGSLVITVAFPPLAALRGYAGAEVALLSVIAALLVVRHLGNIRRLLRHEERDLIPRHTSGEGGS